MKIKFILLQILVFSCLSSFSQSSSNELKVQGESHFSATPEEMIVYIDVETKDSIYSICSEELLKRYNHLIEILTTGGIEKEIIKTRDLKIKENYDWEKGVRIPRGFIGSINVILTLKYSPEKLNSIIGTLKNNDKKFTYTISFQLSEKQKNELLENSIKFAVEDATLKAKFISESLNLKLVGVKEINFGYVPPREDIFAGGGMFHSYFIEDKVTDGIVLNPQKIEIRNSIGIIWEVK